MSAVADSKPRFPSLRLPFVLSAVAAVALVLAVVGGVLLYRAQHSALVGTDLGGAVAPAFHLTDQNGQPVSLAQFHGKPVVLTFLYTHCPDVCPLIADQIHQGLTQLGPQAGKVGVIAVSTDPVGDNRLTATKFTAVHGLSGQLHYLLGSPAQLAPVWKDYYIGVTPAGDGASTVTHSAAIFLIDKDGRERAVLGVPFRSQDLASDLRTLIGE